MDSSHCSCDLGQAPDLCLSVPAYKVRTKAAALWGCSGAHHCPSCHPPSRRGLTLEGEGSTNPSPAVRAPQVQLCARSAISPGPLPPSPQPPHLSPCLPPHPKTALKAQGRRRSRPECDSQKPQAWCPKKHKCPSVGWGPGSPGGWAGAGPASRGTLMAGSPSPGSLPALSPAEESASPLQPPSQP